MSVSSQKGGRGASGSGGGEGREGGGEGRGLLCILHF